MSRLFRITICIGWGVLVVGSPLLAEKQPASEYTKALVKQTRPVPATIDIALDANHVLRGTLVDRQGRAVVGASVEVLPSRGKKTNTKTDAQGRFQFANLSSGLAALGVGGQVQKVRLWPAQVAPPSAQRQTLLVVGSTVRGQCASDGCAGCDACGSGAAQGHFGGLFQRILQNPWIVGAGTAAAIAIPLATDDDDAS